MGREEDTGKVAESAGGIHAGLRIELFIVYLHHVLILNMIHFGQGQAVVFCKESNTRTVIATLN